MKPRDFGVVLTAFGEALDAAGARQAKHQLATFAAIFEVAPEASVAARVKRMASLPTLPTGGTPNLGDLAHIVAPLRKLFEKTAKAAVVADIETLTTLLRDRAATDLAAFARLATEPRPVRKSRKATTSSIREDLVADYGRKLEAHLGDQEAFASIYNELRSNNEIGKGELAVLAKQFAGASVRSKAEALKKIWNRYQQLLVFKAKAAATDGRSAA
jgi:hypothetical protein